MDIILCLLILFVVTVAFDSGAWNSQCISDTDCTTWSDIDDLSNVPHEVKNCCTILRIRDDGCPIGNAEYDLDIQKCACFCPVKITYEWGPEVFYLNRQTCSNEQLPCTLPPNSKAIFKNSPLPAFVNSTRAIRSNFFGGFNDRAVMASSGTMLRTANVMDYPNHNHGGYWTFIPLYKVTCGTYTETLETVESSEKCFANRNQTNNVGNVCIREPVVDPDDNHLAIGSTQLVPVTKTRQGKWQGKADSEFWTKEYSSEGVALPYDEEDDRHDLVRWGFGEFQKRSDLITQTGISTKPATAYKIDENSPLTNDCLEAAGQFYTPLWNNQQQPDDRTWSNGCYNQTPTSMMQGSRSVLKPCIVIGTYQTCQIQLMFDDIDLAYAKTPDPTAYYSSKYSNRDGGGIWSLLNSFQTIFNEATDSELGRTAGIVEFLNDPLRKGWVVFVPSNGAKVTLKS